MKYDTQKRAVFLPSGRCVYEEDEYEYQNSEPIYQDDELTIINAEQPRRLENCNTCDLFGRWAESAKTRPCFDKASGGMGSSWRLGNLLTNDSGRYYAVKPDADNCPEWKGKK